MGAQGCTHRRRLTGTPVKTRKPRAAVQPYYVVIAVEVATLIEPINEGDPPPRQPLLDRQALATFLAGVLLLLISFTTNYGYGDLQHFGTLAIDEQGLF